MKICVVGDKDTVTGFRLAGIPKIHVVQNAEELIVVLRQVINEPEIGLVIVSEQLAKNVGKEIDMLMEGRMYPILLQIPGKQGNPEDRMDPIQNAIRRAVGIDIKL